MKPIVDGFAYSPSPVTVKFPSAVHLILSVNLVVPLDFYLMTNISGNPALCSCCCCCCCCDPGRPSSRATEPSLRLRSLAAWAPPAVVGCSVYSPGGWGGEGSSFTPWLSAGTLGQPAALIRKTDLRALLELGCH